MRRARERAEAERKAQDLVNKARGKGFMEYLAAHKKENERLAALDKTDRDRRAAVQRKWEKRRKRNALSAQKERNDALLVQAKADAKKQKTLWDISNLGTTRKPGIMGTLEFYGERWKSSKASSFISSASKAIGKITVGLFVLEQVLRKVGRAIGAVAGFIGHFVSEAGKAKKQVLTLTAVMGGNRNAAEKLREGLVGYARDTAFSVDQTMQMATQLKALGFATEAILPSIKKFGQLSFGDPEKMKLIAKAYSDVKALGKLQAKEVMQFANQGVALRGALMQQLNLTASELNKAIEDGLVSFTDVDKALTSLTDKFGRTDLLGLETLEGQFESMKETFDQMAAILGGPLHESLVEIAREMNIILDIMMKSGMVEGGAVAIKGMPIFFMLDQTVQQLKLVGRWMAMNKVAWEELFGTDESAKRARKDLADLTNIEEDFDKAARERAKLARSDRLANAEAKAMDKRVALSRKLRTLQQEELMFLAKKKALTTGNNSDQTRLEEIIRMETEYQRLVDEGRSKSKAREMANREHELVILEEQKKLEEIKQERLKIEEKILGKDLSSTMPNQAFRQGSVDEWMYEQQLKKQKADDERAAKTEREANNSRMAAAQEVVNAIDGLSIGESGTVTGV